MLEAKRKENEKQISMLREKKVNLEADIIKMEKTMHLESGDLESTKERKSELAGELKKIDAGIQEINNSINTNNRTLAELKINKQKLRSQASEIRDPAILAELSVSILKLVLN